MIDTEEQGWGRLGFLPHAATAPRLHAAVGASRDKSRVHVCMTACLGGERETFWKNRMRQGLEGSWTQANRRQAGRPSRRVEGVSHFRGPRIRGEPRARVGALALTLTRESCLSVQREGLPIPFASWRGVRVSDAAVVSRIGVAVWGCQPPDRLPDCPQSAKTNSPTRRSQSGHRATSGK